MDPLLSGKLFWGEAEVSRKSLWRMKRRQHYISLLLANPYAFYEYKTRIGALLHDIEAMSGKTAAELLQEIKIPVAALDQPVEALSGVMRIHLALSRIQQNQSPVVLIDDIFRYVTPEVWQSVSDGVSGIMGGSQALLLASRFTDCLRVTDYILVIHQGTLIEGGPRDVILSNPAHPVTCALVQHKTPGPTNPTTAAKKGHVDEDAISNGEAISLSPGHWVYPT